MAPPSFSFIQDLPEFIKLILASLLVAISIHAYLTSRRNKIEEARRGPTVNGRVGAVGSSVVGVDDNNDKGGIDECISGESRDDGVDVNDEGQISGNSSSIAVNDNPASKKKKVSRNNVSNRNYDALICKMAEDQDGDDNEDKSKDPDQKKSSTSNSKEVNNQTNATQGRTLNEEPTASTSAPPQIELKSQTNHPGLQGYCNWHTTITSLYRIYAIPHIDKKNNNNNTFHQAILPMHPSSERGQVPVYIEVTNRTSHKVQVYWIDYKGNEVYKGQMSSHGGVWTQTTFIGHPWTFRIGPGEENVLLRYAPFRAIPSIEGARTSRVEQDGTVEGMQKFVLRDVREGYVSRMNDGLTPVCFVEDAILPEPSLIDSYKVSHTSSSFTSKEMDIAIIWSCQQIQREDAIYHGNGIASAKRLLQYLKNICLHPNEPKYRKLRLGNKIFQQAIYNTGARGVLLALGFEELYGYMECGPGGGKILPHERIQQISDAMMVVNRTLKIMEEGINNGSEVQPVGGDGFGRAGFGHAGGMNL